jgi:hypothetical protein
MPNNAPLSLPLDCAPWGSTRTQWNNSERYRATSFV